MVYFSFIYLFINSFIHSWLIYSFIQVWTKAWHRLSEDTASSTWFTSASITTWKTLFRFLKTRSTNLGGSFSLVSALCRVIGECRVISLLHRDRQERFRFLSQLSLWAEHSFLGPLVNNLSKMIAVAGKKTQKRRNHCHIRNVRHVLLIKGCGLSRISPSRGPGHARPPDFFLCTHLSVYS